MEGLKVGELYSFISSDIRLVTDLGIDLSVKYELNPTGVLIPSKSDDRSGLIAITNYSSSKEFGGPYNQRFKNLEEISFSTEDSFIEIKIKGGNDKLAITSNGILYHPQTQQDYKYSRNAQKIGEKIETWYRALENLGHNE